MSGRPHRRPGRAAAGDRAPAVPLDRSAWCDPIGLNCPVTREGERAVEHDGTQPSSPALELLSLGDAARHLGLSVDTIRRRVKDGSLEARKVRTRYGPAWRVELDGVRPAARATDSAATPPPTASNPAELLHLVVQSNARIAALAEQVGYL